MSRIRWTYFFITIFFIFFMIASGYAEVNTQMNHLMEKVRQLQSLIIEKADKGLDVSEALELDRQSREAFEKGETSMASKLLDEAIKNLSDLSKKDNKIRSVSLPVQANKVIVTSGIPRFERGQDLNDFKTAFETKTVTPHNGIAYLEISSIPVFVEEGSTSSRVTAQPEDSPFGFHPAYTPSIKVSRKKLPSPSIMGHSYDAALDIGIKWNRLDYYALWDIIQKTDEDIKKGNFDWKENDYVFGTVPKGIAIIANIGGLGRRTLRGEEPFPRTFQFNSSYLEEKYVYFVKKLVERYDGDGIDDMPGLKNPIKYWQVDNEPDLATKDWEGYAHLMEITYNAIKSSCKDCKVIMGGLAQGEKGFQLFFLPILKKLNGKYIDVFDFHHYGPAGAWKVYKNLYDTIKKDLSQNGYTNIPIWITETGTYTDKPKAGGPIEFLPRQTEKQQASDLIKRYVYALSLGIKKVFWAFGVMDGFEDKDIDFDFMGLIYSGRLSTDPGFGVKKLSYYSFKMMTEKLEGCNFQSIESLNLGSGIYAYRLKKEGKSVYVLWSD